MTRPGYLLVQTKAGDTAQRFLRDALVLAQAGEPVWLFLVADGIAAGLGGAGSGGAGLGGAGRVTTEIIAAGATVWLDEFTLAQRALSAAPVLPGTVTVGMDTVSERLLVPGTTVVWN